MVGVLEIVYCQNYVAMCQSKYDEVIDVCRNCNSKVIYYYLRFAQLMELSNGRGSGDRAQPKLQCHVPEQIQRL